MRKNKKPIIESLLDLDFYKLTMMQVARKRFRNISVKYAFKNRTKKVALTDYIREADLRRELEHIKTLKFTDEEIDYLRESKYIPKGRFSKDFLVYLKKFQLSDFRLSENGPTFKIEIDGMWPEAILWETLILSVISELYSRVLQERNQDLSDELWKEGDRRLSKKIEILKDNPFIKFADFSTRRRAAKKWQEHFIGRLLVEIPDQFLGTSNVFFAEKFGIPPIGTFAHEMDMIFSGIYHSSDEEILASHNKVLRVWWEEYGESLSIALTDTYGTDFFFSNFTLEQAKKWKGLRQDSGDPFEFGEKTIAFYKRRGIDPKTKTIVFSDGLDIKTIVELYNRFNSYIQVVFGWGTNLGNDWGYKPISIVVKAVKACGHGLVKLSDNIAKAIGEQEDIERFKRIFGYTNILNKPCIY